jgi:hypothetical protein
MSEEEQGAGEETPSGSRPPIACRVDRLGSDLEHIQDVIRLCKTVLEQGGYDDWRSLYGTASIVQGAVQQVDAELSELRDEIHELETRARSS